MSGPTRGWALFAHCFTCSENAKAAVRVSRGLAGEGFGGPSLRHHEVGQSEGDFRGWTRRWGGWGVRFCSSALGADEPRAVGRTDAGPTPYDLVAAGLGACTAMTLRMSADRKGWTTEGVEGVGVRLRHRRLHGEDERECKDDGEARLDVLEREIHVEGPELTPDRRRRLLEVADRCPVDRTLDAGVRIETRPMDAGGD